MSDILKFIKIVSESSTTSGVVATVPGAVGNSVLKRPADSIFAAEDIDCDADTGLQAAPKVDSPSNFGLWKNSAVIAKEQSGKHGRKKMTVDKTTMYPQLKESQGVAKGYTTEDQQIDGMAQGEIREIIKNAIKIKNYLDSGVSLDGWMYSYVTTSNDHLNSVAEQIGNPNIGDQDIQEDVAEGKTGPGLWANIHAKQERIKHGSGERMRKPGSKGAPTAKNFKDAASEGVQLDEIDFSSGLSELSLSPEQMFNQSKVDGTIGSRKVYFFNSGEHKIYFFMNEQKIDALVYLFDNRLFGMKNFSPNKGLIYNLFQYIINIKRQRVRLTPEDKLTSYGIKWIIDQIERPTGFKITDSNGNKIDPAELYKEWENARISGKSGPTEIVIGESKNSKQLRENERRLMPMDIFGSTLVENKDQNVSRIQMMNILESGTKNFKDAASEGVAEGSQRVDSLVSDALKIMKGPEVSDAVAALKTVLGNREFNGRRGFYNFYIKQMLDMYDQQGVAEGNKPKPIKLDKTEVRNPVAKNAMAAIGGGAAGAHKDKKKADKQGQSKHKNRAYDLAEGKSQNRQKIRDALIKQIVDRHASLIHKFTAPAVMSAIELVSEWHDDAEEIGSSDISGWVKEVDRYLRTRAGQGINEVGDKHSGVVEAEGQDSTVSDVTSSIVKRIMSQRMDLVTTFGVNAVVEAIDDVAEGLYDVDEIGSSDISGWVKEVERYLEGRNSKDLNEVSDKRRGVDQDNLNELSTEAYKNYMRANVDDRMLHATSDSFKSGADGDKYNKSPTETPRGKKRERGFDLAMDLLPKSSDSKSMIKKGMAEAEGSDSILPRGTQVKVPHKGKMVAGKIVRYDEGKGGYSDAYVVDIGEYESLMVPKSKVQQSMAEGFDDPDWDEKIQSIGQKAKQADALKAKGREPRTRWNPETKKYYVDFSDPDETPQKTNKTDRGFRNE